MSPLEFMLAGGFLGTRKIARDIFIGRSSRGLRPSRVGLAEPEGDFPTLGIDMLGSSKVGDMRPICCLFCRAPHTKCRFSQDRLRPEN